MKVRKGCVYVRGPSELGTPSIEELGFFGRLNSILRPRPMSEVRISSRPQKIFSSKSLIILPVLFLSAACFLDSACAKGFSDRIVAVVNGDVILKSDVAKQKQPVMRNFFQLPLGVVPPGKVPTEREILDELVAIHLLEQEAAKKNVTVDERSVLASIDAIRKRNKVTHDQFVVKLAASGMDYADFVKVYGRHLKLTKLIQMEVISKVKIDEKDGEEFFKKNRGRIDEILMELTTGRPASEQPDEEVKPNIPTEMEVYVGGRLRLRQITLEVPKGAKRGEAEKVKKTAQHVLREAMTGADFGALARKYSQDSLAKGGGDLGIMNYKDMVPGVQKLVQHMKEGDVRPIELKDRVMIFYLEDAKGRTLKKVPIPERERRLLEKRFKEEQQRLKARQPRQPAQAGVAPDQTSEKPNTTQKGANSGKDESAKKDDKGKDGGKSSGILTPEEEKAYQKVRDKVMAIVRTERMEARMKEWIEQLKKDAIIEVKL